MFRTDTKRCLLPPTRCCIVTVGAGFGYGQLGMSHHATDLSIMRCMPNMSCYIPYDDRASVITEKIIKRTILFATRTDKFKKIEKTEKETQFENPKLMTERVEIQS